MTKGIIFTNNNLSIELTESPDSVDLIWSGKSTDRDPGLFLMPIFKEAHKRCGNERRLVFHFEGLEFMNSSTITPIIRMINMVKEGNETMRVVYAKSLKWQELSFSALKSLESPDGRIEVLGN